MALLPLGTKIFLTKTGKIRGIGAQLAYLSSLTADRMPRRACSSLVRFFSSSACAWRCCCWASLAVRCCSMLPFSAPSYVNKAITCKNIQIPFLDDANTINPGTLKQNFTARLIEDKPKGATRTKTQHNTAEMSCLPPRRRTRCWSCYRQSAP